MHRQTNAEQSDPSKSLYYAQAGNRIRIVKMA